MNSADSGRASSHGDRSASESDAKKDRESVGQSPANTVSGPFKASGGIDQDARPVPEISSQDAGFRAAPDDGDARSAAGITPRCVMCLFKSA